MVVLLVLEELVARGRVAVLSGAGLSTDSGIPDYRGETGRARPASPMTYQEFTGSAESRQRYWARSHLGWRFIAGVSPNAGHRAVADLQAQGLLSGIVTAAMVLISNLVADLFYAIADPRIRYR